MDSSRELLVVATLGLALAAAPLAFAEDDGRGRELFQLCAQCHGAAGEGNRTVLAPAIAGHGRWYIQRQLEKFRSGVRGAHPDDVGGLRMYPMSLWLRRDADLEAVAAYAASLAPVWPEPQIEDGDPERGQALGMLCVTCHGADGSGNQQLGGPSLQGSDWYLLTQLRNFKARIRGGNPADVQGAQMYPMANVLADEQAMKDVLAYIRTLRQPAR